MKAVLITGAAQGIGLATAQHFANHGWFVGLYDLNKEKITELLTLDIFKNGCGSYCDVTDNQSIQQALDDFSGQSGGRLDVLINNAGVLFSDHFEKIPEEKNELMIDVNVKGLTNVARLAFPLLKTTAETCGSSTLLNLCSSSSIVAVPLLSVYSSTKFYVDGLTEGLHSEWKEHNIRVCSVKPPPVDTAMIRNFSNKISTNLKAEFQPEEIAKEIYNAAHGHRMSYVLGLKTKIMAFVFQLIPNELKAWLIRKVIG